MIGLRIFSVVEYPVDRINCRVGHFFFFVRFEIFSLCLAARILRKLSAALFIPWRRGGISPA